MDDAYVGANVTILCGGYHLDVGIVVGNRRTVVHGWIVPLRTGAVCVLIVKRVYTSLHVERFASTHTHTLSLPVQTLTRCVNDGI